MILGWTTPNERRHYVYRAFNAAGELLYVGRTIDPVERARAHRRSSPWVSQVERVRMFGPLTYEKSKDVEREALKNEYPLYGITPQKRKVLREASREAVAEIKRELGIY